MMRDEHEREVAWDPGDDEDPYELPRERHPLANALLTICGVFAMASPLLLWISWTREMLMTVFFSALVCIVVCALIVRLGPD